MSAPSGLTALARQLRDQAPWRWLYELEVLSEPPQRIRVTNAEQAISFGFDANGSPLVYEPAPLVMGEIQRTADGDQPSLQVQFGNASLELAALLEELDGFDGSRAVVRLVNSDHLDDTAQQLAFHAEVLDVQVTAELVTIDLGLNPLAIIQALRERYMRLHCRFSYGSARCGARTDVPGLLALVPTCARTRSACDEVGAAELAVGLPVIHPLRFGAWPSLPRQSKR